ncbi:MAG: DUF308 domain-containing protein [Leucobacter sp.]
MRQAKKEVGTMDAVILPPETGQTTTRRFPWWIPLIVGVLVVAVGVGLLIWPFVAASWLLVILFGSALISGGLAALVRQRPGGASIIGGIVFIVAGALAIVFREFTASALVTFVAVALIVAGGFLLAISLRFSGSGSSLVALPAILLICAGIAALIWPSAALIVAAIVAGLCALAIGGAIIGGAFSLRRVSVTTARFSA